MKTYLPELPLSALFTGLHSDNWNEVDECLNGQNYERLGLERALMIATDMLDRFGSLKGIRVLDVGCNNGLFSKTLSVLGCDVVGIDNMAIDGQGLYHQIAAKKPDTGFTYHNADLLDFLREYQTKWDCVLLLSVAHHWETGYAMSGNRMYSDADISHILQTLRDRTRYAIFYECPMNEPSFSMAAGLDFLARHMDYLPPIESLGKTIGPNGYPRELLKIRVS
jgi:SAM-dependent methyltransferase